MPNLKKDFKNFTKRSYIKLDYNQIYNDFKKMLNKEDSKKQDNLKRYAEEIIFNVVQQNVKFKNHIPDEKEAEKMTYTIPSAVHITFQTIGFLTRVCNEINPGVKIKEDFGLTEEDVTRVINSTIDNQIQYSSILEFIEREPFESLLSEFELVNNSIEKEKTYRTLSSPKDKEFLQDIYMKKEMSIRQMDKHGALWRFFHPSKVKAYNEFITKSETLLAKYEFDKYAIEDAVKLYAKVNDHSDDKGYTKEFFSQKKEELAKANQPKGPTVNMVRYDNAVKEEIKTGALKKEMEKITSKYEGMDTQVSSLGMIKSNCQKYDTTNNPDYMFESAKLLFWDFYSQLTSRKSKDFDLKQTMHDANKLTQMVLKTYTPIYEDPQFKDIIPDFAFGSLPAKSIQNATRKALGDSNLNLEEDIQNVIDEYKQQIKVENNVKESIVVDAANETTNILVEEVEMNDTSKVMEKTN